jgi:DNA-binding beta-propeller fold protein YncE
MGGSIQGVPLDLSGTVSTLAGATDLALDGQGAEAVFLHPADVANDGTYLYVADSGNRRIRRVEIATGVVTTLAGSGWPGLTDGTGSVRRIQ